eukprot:595222-Pyramimonas_sp.AAC.1
MEMVAASLSKILRCVANTMQPACEAPSRALAHAASLKATKAGSWRGMCCVLSVTEQNSSMMRPT